MNVTLGDATPENVTPVPVVNPVPQIVTLVPDEPHEGVNPCTVGVVEALAIVEIEVMFPTAS
jgi:hypothetical protein